MTSCVSLLGSTAMVCALALTATSAAAAPFTVAAGSTVTAAQTLGAGAGQIGAVAATGTLSVGGSAVAVTVTGNNATLNNLGTIRQTGTGRVVRDNTGVSGLTINNGSAGNATASMQAAQADVIQMNAANGSVTLNNYGSMISLNPAGGGNQVVDFNAVTTGANVVNNFATGLMQAAEADAVRPGVNGVVNNAGIIRSTTATGSSSDGVDLQSNSGIIIVNANNAGPGAGTGLIEGARHGVTGGPANAATAFTVSIANNLGGTIAGANGSGINIDGFNANQTATIVNAGTITGNGITGDGDGVDVDGLVNISNTGLIQSLNAVNPPINGLAFSEGVSVGGGIIVSSGTIQGLVAVGNANAVGRGITIVGNDITAGPLAGTREAIYGNVTVTNQAGGLIYGQGDSGLLVGGPASGFTVTINNQSGATIRGGGTSAAALQTGADNDTVTNAGVIDGASGGKAIDLGAGNDRLNLQTGTSIAGSIAGGAGVDAIHLSGVGSLSGTTGFETLDVDIGSWTLTGSQSYANGVAIAGGATLQGNGVTLSGPVSVAAGATLGFIGAGSSVDTVTANGAIVTAGTTATFTSLSLAVSGSIQAAVGDVIRVSGSVQSQSAQNAQWNTIGAALQFIGPAESIHALELNGIDLGVTAAGMANNFAWGVLDVQAGNSLSLSGSASGRALYVGAVLGFDIIGGIVQNVVGNGFNIYYDSMLNGALGSRTYQLSNGGLLMAFNPAPAPSALMLFVAGIGLLVGRRRL